MNTPTSYRMYVLTRLDLASTYRAVQGNHALTAFGLEHEVTWRHWNNETLIHLGVSNLRELSEWKKTLEALGKEHSWFLEPDQLGAPTAIACYDSGEIFSKLPLA